MPAGIPEGFEEREHSAHPGSAGYQPAFAGSLPAKFVFGRLPNTAGKLPALPGRGTGAAIGARQSALRSALRLSTTDRPKPRKRVHFQTRNRAALGRPHNCLFQQPVEASDTDYAPVHQPTPNRVLSPKSPAPVPPKSARKIPR